MFSKIYKISINRVLCIFQKQFHINKPLKNNPQTDYNQVKSEFEKLVDTHIDKIVFNSNLLKSNPKFDFKKRLELKKIQKTLANEFKNIEPLPSVLKYLITNEEEIPNTKPISSSDNEKIEEKTHFPFANTTAIPIATTQINEPPQEKDIADSAELEIIQRQQVYADHNNWMLDYENYEGEREDNDDATQWKINYGTPDPNSRVSNIPCGGCGALLHCKDTAIPGYIPSEIFKNSLRLGGVRLQALICQRCHFLKNYNLALQVRVSADDYPKVLETIKVKRGLILLIIDLLDFPCSLWPGIINVLGHKKPIIIAGNKVDLLPRDSRGYLDRIKYVLEETVKESFGKQASKIKHVSLISAKTGWGVEELITAMHNIWGTNGDVFLVGCTNVGKSSLFNCLLQSDFCKIQAVDLVQRATTSVWPGTTMNLLKFPILRPSGWRLFARTKRLQAMNKINAATDRMNKRLLKETGEAKYATLIGHLDRTFTPEMYQTEASDPFAVSGHANASGRAKIGINEKDPLFATSKWCYDTPGVVHPEQIIHLLTTEELTLVLPRDPIQPKSFSIRLGQTVFIAGLARLDYVSGPSNLKVTVFCSESLPITICYTEHAQELYNTFLGTDLLVVPKGSEERMKQWPHLKEAQLPLHLKGVQNNVSCGDILLSNAGWISVSSKYDLSFKAWTPESRGIHVRQSILPFAVELRGKKIRRTPAYTSDKIFIPK
ncbi:hypothetical protein RN001_012310 [Aquatica leii]|uniref:G domain-containing protein n=1 Tax=Aquatica leii TaxID=1421715 RepID=A0AAN7P5C0_9COLE|nr:hypothetical protein RN001_012310 [Aquatica leii]